MTRKPKGSGHERREEILAAALRLFGEHGVHAVSTRQVAAAAGIRQPTLYAYFSAKEDIAVELAKRAFAQLKARIASASTALADDGTGFEAFMRVYIDFGLDNPDAYRVAFMLEGGEHKAAIAERALEAGMAAFAGLVEAVRRLNATGATSEEDPEILAQNLWAASHGLVSLLIARPQFPWADREALIKAHLRLLRRGTLKG